MTQPSSFSTRIALSFGALALMAVMLVELVWYVGIPPLGLNGARDQRLAEATQHLTIFSNQRLMTIHTALTARRGAVLVAAESNTLIETLARGELHALQKTTEQLFERWARAHPNAFLAMRVLDPDTGVVVASSQRDNVGKSLLPRDLLERAQQPGVSELVEIITEREEPALVIVRPVFSVDADGYPEGAALGFVVAVLDMAAVLAVNIGYGRENDEPPGATLLLVARDRVLVRHPAGPEDADAFWRINPLAPGVEGAMELADGAGAEYLSVYRHIPLSGNESLTLIHYQAKELALADLQTKLRNAALTGLLSTLLALAVIYVLSHRLTVPLLQLTETARRLGRGEMSARAKPSDIRELYELTEAFNTMADSTERHRQTLEQKVAEQNQTLSEKLALEASLIQARDLAESANRAKSTFLANMSHELRTPLNAVLGFSYLLQRDQNIGPESRQKLAAIIRSGQHLLALINDVLELSRIEAGHNISTRQPVDLKTLLSDVEEMIRVRAETKGLNFTVTQTADLSPFVMGDGPHLKQVLINLLGNAVKFTEQGTVTLTVTRQHEIVDFEVADTGIGISRQDLEHLFEPFFQTAGSITKGEGSGLGLSISREFTRMMGGQLHVSSRPGHGSTFTLSLTLPACEAPASPTTTPGRIIGLAPDQAAVRVLVVDDRADNRELLKLVLEGLGIEVFTAETGEQAVQAFQKLSPHLIWMDLRMPGMDGYEATRQIRALPAGDQVRIVALTANAFQEDREKALTAGCDDLLPKPLKEDTLLEVMARLLGLRYVHERPEPLERPTAHAIDLSILPANVLHNLNAAAEALDIDVTRQIVASLRATHPDLAAALDSLIQGFRLDRIAELCKLAQAKGQ